MRVDDFVERVDQLLVDGEDLLRRTEPKLRRGVAGLSDEFVGGKGVDPAGFAGFRSAGLSLFANLFGNSHPYYKDFDLDTKSSTAHRVRQAMGILNAAKHELSGGWFRTATGLVAAEIFTDFLDMADHLLDEGYKDAAAVMVGSVLEEHLRRLAALHKVNTTWTDKKGDVRPKKADTLNAELQKAGAYNMLNQKAIVEWLELRNNAAHGHYDQYTADQVRLMHQGVLGFMTRVPI